MGEEEKPWEEQADATADSLRTDLRTLESEFWPDPPGGSYRSFGARARALSERIRTAQPIKLDDKLALQASLGSLRQRAEVDLHEQEESFARLQRNLDDALTLAEETLTDAESVAAIQEVRADLTLLRSRVTGVPAGFPRSSRQELWQRWQRLNGAAWERLNALWQENEARLTSALESAEAQVAAGDSRAAKEAIRAFHTELTPDCCTHRGVRALRERANGIWAAANTVGAARHTAYLQSLRGRIGEWRRARGRLERNLQVAEAQLAELEARLSGPANAIAQALLRGQIDERRRAVSELQRQLRDLNERIDNAEVQLAQEPAIEAPQ